MSKKLTFAQALAERDAAKNNSDLINLATAAQSIQQEQQRLSAALDRIRALAARIEAGELVDVQEVRELYKEATGTSARNSL